MRAIKIESTVRVVDVDSFQQEVGGQWECIVLKDDGAMLVNRDGATNGMPQNPIASLVAGTMVYGPALIVGRDDDGWYIDVPEPFYELLLIEP